MDKAQRLRDAEWLIRELNAHEGAEGWSVYLHKALDDFNAGNKIKRNKPRARRPRH